MTAVEKEGWFTNSVHTREHVQVISWRIRRDDRQRIAALGALEAVSRTADGKDQMVFGCTMSFHVPIFLRTNTSARYLKQTVRAVVSADLYGDTAIASDGITFFTKI